MRRRPAAAPRFRRWVCAYDSRRGVNISGLPYQARVVAQALKRYGLILADNGSPWYISGAPDRRWNNDALHLLDRLSGSDFEVVDTSSLPHPGLDPPPGGEISRPRPLDHGRVDHRPRRELLAFLAEHRFVLPAHVEALLGDRRARSRTPGCARCAEPGHP